MVSRLKLQYCKIILATSMVWFMLDVFLLMYYTDCTNPSECKRNGLDVNPAEGDGNPGRTDPPKKDEGGFLKRLKDSKMYFKSCVRCDNKNFAVTFPYNMQHIIMTLGIYNEYHH